MPEVIFNGPEGRLEGRYVSGASENAPIALILHPDPHKGGSMNNRISYGLFQIYQRRGFSVLRFNFRGVGRSQGIFDRGEGELADAASALDWLQSMNPNARQCWVAGYSFGAWIGMQLLMRRPEIFSYISIAPPAKEYDFTFLAPCPASGLIIHGEADPVVPVDAVNKLVQKLRSQRDISVDYRIVDGAGHLFADQMDELFESVEDHLDGVLEPALVRVKS